VDDLALFADDKTTLWTWKSEVEQYLERLRLTIHSGAQPRPVAEGIPFLGFVAFPQHRRLKRRKAVYFGRRFRGRLLAYRAGEVPLATVTAGVRGWVNHARYGNTVGLRQAILTRRLVHPPGR
jgi:hypothetical protein